MTANTIATAGVYLFIMLAVCMNVWLITASERDSEFIWTRGALAFVLTSLLFQVLGLICFLFVAPSVPRG